MGKILAVTLFIGGSMIIRSLMSASPNAFLLYGGLLVVLVSLVLFVRELTKI